MKVIHLEDSRVTPAVIAAGLEAAFNRILRLDPEVLPRLTALDGLVIAVEFEGLGLSLYLLPGADGIRVVDRCEAEPTVRVRGTPLALVRYWRGDRTASGEIVVEGDAATGQAFQSVLTRLEIDWEEQLSRVVGDAVAHGLGNLWRGFRDWSRRAGDILRRDGVEYLQQELRALPSPQAVERFLNAVDALREDTDRLTARTERLRRRLTAGGPV